MIGALIRRDASIRFLGRWMFVGPLVTLSMMGLIAYIRFSGGSGAGRGGAELFLMPLTLWTPAAIYLGVNFAERRCSRFDMELPISARVLWTAHTLALSLAGIMLLAATVGVLLFIAWAARALPGSFPAVFEAGDVVVALRVASVLLLGVAAAQSVLPSLERIPSGQRLIWTINAGINVPFLLVLALLRLPVVACLVPLALAGFLAWRTWSGLPATVVTAPLEPVWFGSARETGDRTVPSDANAWTEAAPARSALRRFWTFFLVIFRSTTKMPVAPIVGLPILIAAGFTMAGAFGSALRGDDAIRFSLLFIIAYTLLSFSGLPPRKLFVLDALPVSRRLIFAIMFVPYVAVLGLGYGAGRIVADRAENESELICYRERDGHYFVSLPLRNGALAMDGSPPAAIAPSGESHDVWSREIMTGSKPVVHALYSTPPGSSIDFVAWQVSRAAEAVYGERISPDEVRERYLALDADGRVVPAGGELTLAADHPEWSVRPYAPVFPVMMLVVCGLWFMAMAVYLRTLRAGFTEKQKRGTFWWGMIVLMVLHISQFGLLIADRLDHWVLSGFGMIAVRELSAWLPGGAVSVWVLCGAVLYAFYRMAERQFLQVESNPGDDMRIALIERPLGAAGAEGAYAK